MLVLLDTHVLLWLLFDDRRLTPRATEALENSRCHVSIVSFWEMAVKISLGKLRLPKSLAEIAEACRHMDIDIDELTMEDCVRVQTLPFIHRDPFDRIIIEHAMEQQMTLISHDGLVRQYPSLHVIW